MTSLPRPTTAACGFACALIGLGLGCDAPPNDRPPPGGRSRTQAVEAVNRGDEPPVPPRVPGPLPAEPLSVGDVLLTAGLTADDLAAGRVALFDGRTLFGWGGDGDDADGVTAADGKLHIGGDSRSHVGAIHRTPLIGGDVRFQWRHGPRAEASVVVRDSAPHSGEPLPGVLHRWYRGEMPAGDWWDGGVTLDGGRAAIRLGEKNGGRLFVPPALLHLTGEQVAYRHVTFRPDTAPLPLTAFTPVPGNAAKIARENDTLRLTGGPGFLVSEQQYGDFVLQCEVNLHAPDSNSGLFFRTVEPTETAPSNGYEVQLQNTLGPGDRTDPDDYGDGFGTGGIFRRQPARYVNADDGEWFHLTLVCVGNRMATWVNGLQVTDFTDDREPDPNPRKGRRDEPGYLVLQGHDPTTDVSFRNVRVQELASD